MYAKTNVSKTKKEKLRKTERTPESTKRRYLKKLGKSEKAVSKLKIVRMSSLRRRENKKCSELLREAGKNEKD